MGLLALAIGKISLLYNEIEQKNASLVDSNCDILGEDN
jgi:hypothetical protein